MTKSRTAPLLCHLFCAAILATLSAARAATLLVSCEGGTINQFDTITGANLGPLLTNQNGAQDMVFDAAGNLYIANNTTNSIIKRTPAGVVTTLASGGGLATPFGLAIDGGGNLFAPNFDANTVSKITPAGVVSNFVPNTAGLSRPVDAAFDSAGNLYVANSNSNVTKTIQRVTPAGVVTTFAQGAPLFGVAGLAFDLAGNLYVTNHTANTISKITPAGMVSTFVNNTMGLNFPEGLAFDDAGNLFVANLGDFTIRKVTPAGNVSIFANTSAVFPGGNTARPEFIAIVPVPEPSALNLVGLGLGVRTLAGRPKRRA